LAWVLVALWAGCGVPLEAGESDEAVKYTCATKGTVRGIDVSTYQGAISWSKVHGSGVEFAIARATLGTTYSDPTFKTNWAGIKSAGMIRGAYHYFHPDKDATVQADRLVDAINAAGGLKPGDLPPMLDLEVLNGVSAATAVSRAKTFLARIEQRTGRRALVYSYVYFFQSTLGNPDLSAYPLNIADYRGRACPDIPDAFKTWVIWQYTDSATVPGVSGGVDGDYFNGSLADLKLFTGLQPPIPDLGTKDAAVHDAAAHDAAVTDAAVTDPGLPDAGLAPDLAPEPPGMPPLRGCSFSTR
jgi:GH25 family lysozyme M1 (1,4-beta-N-acetylmuramidase)